MKKIISLMLVILLTFTMIGCGNDKGNADETLGEGATGTESNDAEGDVEAGADGTDAITNPWEYFVMNGVSFTEPFTVAELIDALGVDENDEQWSQIVPSRGTQTFHLNYEINFGVQNRSNADQPLTECYVWFIDTLSSSTSYDITYPGSIKMGETFNEAEAAEMIGLSPSTGTNEEGIKYYFFDNEELAAYTDVDHYSVTVEVSSDETIIGINYVARIDFSIESEETLDQEQTDVDMSGGEIMEETDESDSVEAEYEGFLQEVKLYNQAFQIRKVTMYMPVEYLGVASDKNIYCHYLQEQDSHLLVGGQVSMGAPQCESSDNILEFYEEQVYTEFENSWLVEDKFEMVIDSKEAMDVNGHSMWKYNGTIKGGYMNGIEKEYPFVAYATTAEDSSIFWLLADTSDNKDQMGTLEEQAQTMAQSYTIK